MANICTFSMRILGTEENCEAFIDSRFNGLFDLGVTRQQETEDGVMLQIDGECRGSVESSMVKAKTNSLAEKSEQYSLEIEVFGYDRSEPEWLEHYHFIGEKCITSYTDDCPEWDEEAEAPVMEFEMPDFSEEEDGNREKFVIEEDTLSEYNGSESEVIVPEGIRKIDYGVFQDHDEIESITLPESLEIIKDSAFGGCTGLRKIVIPQRVTQIGAEAFIDCTGLEEAVVPECAEMSNLAFGHCTGLCDEHGMAVVNGVLSAYNGEGEEAVIPEGVKVIDSDVFCENTALKRVTFPRSLRVIRSLTFTGCEGLTELVFPEGLETVEYGAFEECKNLTRVVFPNSIRQIEGSVFYNCIGLETVVLPEKEVEIGSRVFYGCEKIADRDGNLLA